MSHDFFATECSVTIAFAILLFFVITASLFTTTGSDFVKVYIFRIVPLVDPSSKQIREHVCQDDNHYMVINPSVLISDPPCASFDCSSALGTSYKPAGWYREHVPDDADIHRLMMSNVTVSSFFKTV